MIPPFLEAMVERLFQSYPDAEPFACATPKSFLAEYPETAPDSVLLGPCGPVFFKHFRPHATFSSTRFLVLKSDRWSLAVDLNVDLEAPAEPVQVVTVCILDHSSVGEDFFHYKSRSIETKAQWEKFLDHELRVLTLEVLAALSPLNYQEF